MQNEFHDINKLPATWGLLIFPISMSRIENAQSAKSCFDYIHIFDDKISAPKVGAHFIYTEGLYMNFEEKAYETKNKFAQKMVNHMCGLQKLLTKNFKDYQIPHAFSFEAWFQMYLSHTDFLSVIARAKALYDTDALFQKLIAEDTRMMDRELTQQQINFLIEEHVFSYLLLNRQLKIRNEHIENREEWLLLTYPGKPLVSEIYFYQKDILGINSDKNPYKGHYDLLERKFYDFTKIDIATLNFK
jgi:hypothetical protein